MTNQILQTFSKKSSILTSVLLMLMISSQLAASQTVKGVCTYSNDSKNGYTCTLTNVTILNSTDILEITGDHFQGHADVDVTSVIFDSNKIAFFNGEIMRKFSNLRHIHMVAQGLKEFSHFAFDVCPNLEELVIGDDKVKQFPTGMLKMCANLRYFSVFGYELTYLTEDIFGETKNLEELRISNTKLTSIPGNLLKNMENLRIFVATQNLIKLLNPNFFINVRNLQELDLSKNELNNSQNIIDTLNGHISLVKLDLSYNDFSNFDFTFFSQFLELKELVVGSKVGPELTKISWQSLPASLTDLTVYEVGENLPINMCSQLIALKSLAVTGYGIKDIHKDTFKSLGHLEMLSLQSTKVKALDPELFVPFTSLSDLNLDYNFLKELPLGIFTPLVNIGSKSEYHGISMFVNNLKRLNANFFGKHPQMRSFNFSSNLLEEIERGIFSKFHSNLTRVGLQANICVDRQFINVSNLDGDETLKLCFDNWAGKTIPTTTPSGCGGIFKKIEVLCIFIVGFVLALINFNGK
ncbi:hypothetical protein ACKWTF_015887 [Chironomus riparius]